MTPFAICQRRTARLLEDMQRLPDYEALETRADYCNKLSQPFDVRNAVPIRALDRSRSRYFIDLNEHARWYGPDLRLQPLFGDIVYVPGDPSFVKSRPIHGAKENSLLLNLDKLRHFNWTSDPVPFRDKKPAVVWRGGARNPARRTLVKRFYNHPEFDIGHTSRKVEGFAPKPRLTHKQQKQFRYFLSLEGHDVATNLKWGMASNMLVMAPAMRFETWFMEGALVPDTHFVLLKDDFSDLEEKVFYFNDHPDEAEDIIENAHTWLRQFTDPIRERMVSARILQKCFQLSGQL